jgi:membrane protein implicated in regulation of membrane protease activity
VDLAQIILIAATAYAIAGSAFALAFISVGMSAIDRAAQSAPLTVRILVFPGAVALWPMLLRRWISARRSRP